MNNHPVTNEVLAERIEYTREDLKEMKDDIKVIKEQTLKTNGRVNKHDDEMVYLHQGVKAFFEKEEREHAEATDKIRKLKSILLKFGIAIVGSATAANELPQLIKNIVHNLWGG